MAGPGPGEILHSLELVVLIGYQQGDRTTKGLAPPDAAEQLHVIGLDLLPPAAAISPLPPPQLGVDQIRVNGHPGGKPVDQGQQCLAMGFAGSPVS